jgi:hypothetical protein
MANILGQVSIPYKGYVIKSNPLNGLVWIEKDGFKIASFNDISLEEVKRIIDKQLVTDSKTSDAMHHPNVLMHLELA